MPDIQTKYVHTNNTEDELVCMSYGDLFRYTQMDKFFCSDRLRKLYPGGRYNEVGDDEVLFFKYDEVDDLINDMRKIHYDTDKKAYLDTVDKYEMNTKIDLEQRQFISIDFEFRNEMKHEEIELGGKIQVFFEDPESDKDIKMVEDIRNNKFFQALGAKEDLEFCISEYGDKGVVIDNVFYDEKFINKYLEKYPNENDSSYHSEPKADDLNMVKAMENHSIGLEL